MKKKKTVLIPLSDGFEESEAVIVADLLRRADISVILAGCDTLEVKSARNITLICDKLLNDVNNNAIDGIILPGGIEGTKNLMRNIRVRELLIDMDRQNLLVAAICAAPTVLYAAGITGSRSITSHPAVANEFQGVSYREEKVVIDGNMITSRGVGTTIDFALTIVEYLSGKEKKSQISRAICYGF